MSLTTHQEIHLDLERKASHSVESAEEGDEESASETLKSPPLKDTEALALISDGQVLHYRGFKATEGTDTIYNLVLTAPKMKSLISVFQFLIF